MVDINRDGVVLDLNGFTLTSSDNFTSTYPNDAHLLQITGDNVTVKNGKIVTTEENKHGVNVYQATGVVLEGLTIDNTKTFGGAPIIVNASDVTVSGALNLTVGENSWYGINVDPKEGSASLTFAAGSSVAMTGNDGKLVIVPSEGAVIEGAKDAGLKEDENGNYIPAPEEGSGNDGEKPSKPPVHHPSNPGNGDPSDSDGLSNPNEKPESSTQTPSDENPNTGDSSDLLALMAVAAVSLCGLTTGLILKRKGQN